MKPQVKKNKPKSRPKVRSRNGHRRTKSIQIKLSDEEYDIIRCKYGRVAAAIARDHLLGFESKAAEAPNAGSVMPMVRALYACQVEIAHLGRYARAKQTGAPFLETLKLLDVNFEHLIRTWSSNFSTAKK
ncbi:MAG: hypothetical protein ACSHX9_01560 [Luteolibacter sp.]